METSFKVKKYKEYFDIQYVTGLNLPYMTNDNFLATNKQWAKKTIDLIRKMEEGIKKVLVEEGLNFDYRFITLKHLNAIDSIASGIDIRSKMSIEELSDRFVWSFKKKHDEVLAEVQATFHYFNDVKSKSSYLVDWRRYDRYNGLIKTHMLDFPSIKNDDFAIDELKNLNKLASEALDSLIEYNKKLQNEK
jgi:hypothetical protein